MLGVVFSVPGHPHATEATNASKISDNYRVLFVVCRPPAASGVARGEIPNPLKEKILDQTMTTTKPSGLKVKNCR